MRSGRLLTIASGGTSTFATPLDGDLYHRVNNAYKNKDIHTYTHKQMRNACPKCCSDLVQYSTTSKATTCLACKSSWNVLELLICKQCGSEVSTKRILRLNKDGKAGWHKCDKCGCLAHMDHDSFIQIESVQLGSKPVRSDI